MDSHILSTLLFCPSVWHTRHLNVRWTSQHLGKRKSMSSEQWIEIYIELSFKMNQPNCWYLSKWSTHSPGSSTVCSSRVLRQIQTLSEAPKPLLYAVHQRQGAFLLIRFDGGIRTEWIEENHKIFVVELLGINPLNVFQPLNDQIVHRVHLQYPLRYRVRRIHHRVTDQIHLNQTKIHWIFWRLHHHQLMQISQTRCIRYVLTTHVQNRSILSDMFREIPIVEAFIEILRIQRTCSRIRAAEPIDEFQCFERQSIAISAVIFRFPSKVNIRHNLLSEEYMWLLSSCSSRKL